MAAKKDKIRRSPKVKPLSEKKGAGRPEKFIDWDLVDRLLEAGCNGVEVASHFNMHPDNFYDRVLKEKGQKFTDYACELYYKGDSNIRLTQYLKATGQSDKGDNTMMVWLGKNRLKQRENPTELTVSNETVQSFKEIMNQVKSAQEAKKLEKEEDVN